MSVRVQEIGKTSNGNPKVKINGSWFFLARGCEPPPPTGIDIEIKEGSFTFPDGKLGKTIEAWKPAGGNGSPPQQQNAPAPAAPPADYIDEAHMRFISNCVGSAIAAGTLKSPDQILHWFQAAKAAIDGKAAPIPF